MKKIFLSLAFIAICLASQAQTKFFTKNGKITFDATSASSPEKISAINEKATSILEVSTGALEFAILMKAFNFEKALMQEHFNENYVESDEYPKAVFKGSVLNMSTVDLKKDGDYKVNIKGMMTLHGETKEVTATGTLTVKDNAITNGKSSFSIPLEDYKIIIPTLVKDKVAKDAQIIVEINYQPFKAS
jgi:hypothetical protein